MKQFHYYMISDRRLLLSPLVEAAAEAEKAGVSCFQLREKDLTARELLLLARQLRRVLRNTLFIVNGSLEVALASKADGVHLQKNNVPVKGVRSRFKDLIIGYSAHCFEELKEAEEQGADYVFISPVFQPISKASRAVPLGIQKISSWIRFLKIPVYALGGISSHNLPEVRESGCSGAAGISFFLDNGRFAFRRMVSE